MRSQDAALRLEVQAATQARLESERRRLEAEREAASFRTELHKVGGAGGAGGRAASHTPWAKARRGCGWAAACLQAWQPALWPHALHPTQTNPRPQPMAQQLQSLPPPDSILTATLLCARPPAPPLELTCRPSSH
jgi:hypothetical protein